MEKIDLTKLYKSYYTAKAIPELVQVDRAVFVSILGKGDPSGASFVADIQLLYPVAYGVKAICKAAGRDFGVPKLEGQWWFDEEKFGSPSMDEAPVKVPRSEWEYRLLIRLPDFVEEAMVAQAVQTVVSKKKMPDAAKVHFFEMTEGACVQIMHTGPFSEEPATLQKLNEFMQAKGMRKNGLHHEIYLSDFRTTAPEKLKTILREPFVPANSVANPE
ncbi:MAG: GyrI-like domain-containing protein [Saprospiraceae bacterium]|nr:GyrI-like domain-containing protein [Saprospiraceae bacterium]